MGTPLLKMSKLGAQPVQGTPSCAWEERGFLSCRLAPLRSVKTPLLRGPRCSAPYQHALLLPPLAGPREQHATRRTPHTHNPRRPLGSPAASHPMGSSLGNFVRPARGSGGGSINNPSSLRGARAPAHLHPNATWSGSGRASCLHYST